VEAAGKPDSGEGKQEFRPESSEEERESPDSKLIFLIPAFGYVVGLGNLWCFRTGQRRVGVVS
jgi:hypothetical protein